MEENKYRWIVAQLSDGGYQWACTFYVPAKVKRRGAKGKRKRGTSVYHSFDKCQTVCDKLNLKESGHLN